MTRRSQSPAVSETGVDISTALLQDDQFSGSENEGQARNSVGQTQSFNPDTIPNINDEESSGDDANFIAEAQIASNRKASNLKGRTVKKGGGFQAMGLNASLLKAITKKGFSVPTPIQRKTIPLVLDGQDVVGMARR